MEAMNQSPQHRKHLGYLVLLLLIVFAIWAMTTYFSSNATTQANGLSDKAINDLIVQLEIGAGEEQDANHLLQRILYHHLDLTKKNILVIGGNGYLLMPKGKRHDDFVFVDFRPHSQQKTSACNYLDFTTEGYTHVYQLSRDVLKRHYHVIVVNIDPQRFKKTTYMLESPQLSQLKNHLQPHGILIVNNLAPPAMAAKLAQQFNQRITKQFMHCYVWPINHPHSPSRRLTLCQV
jgi:hypothetical protein